MDFSFWWPGLNKDEHPSRCVCLSQAVQKNSDTVQPFSQKSRTATVPKVFQIGFCGVVEADLELFWNSWSVGFLGERLYALHLTLELVHRSSLGHPWSWHHSQNKLGQPGGASWSSQPPHCLFRSQLSAE